ncbi:MAG: hypothetical protein ACUVQM_04830 [Candidatus Hadarchaeaceae archaeon]
MRKTKKGKVKKAGWFNPPTGKEAVFDKGYLYFLTNEQYKQRLAKRNVLSGIKQAGLRADKAQHRDAAQVHAPPRAILTPLERRHIDYQRASERLPRLS